MDYTVKGFKRDSVGQWPLFQQTLVTLHEKHPSTFSSNCSNYKKKALKRN